MSVYYMGLFISTVFANLQGVDVAYWPTGQIGLLIQSFTKPFFILLIPISFKAWELDVGQFNILSHLPSAGLLHVDCFDLICWGFWDLYCWDFLHCPKTKKMNVIWFVSLK